MRPDPAADLAQHAAEHMGEIRLDGGLHGDIRHGNLSHIHVHFFHAAACRFHDALDQLRVQPDITGDMTVKNPADGL